MTRGEYAALVRELDLTLTVPRTCVRDKLAEIREHDTKYAERLKEALDALDALHETS